VAGVSVIVGLGVFRAQRRGPVECSGLATFERCSLSRRIPAKTKQEDIFPFLLFDLGNEESVET
jgi:hypothetical protein